MVFDITKWNKKRKMTAGIALLQKGILEKNADLLDLNYKRLCDTKDDMEGVIHTATLTTSMIGNHNDIKEIKAIIKLLKEVKWEVILKDKKN